MEKQTRTTSRKQKIVVPVKPHVNKIALQPFPHPNLIIHPKLAKKDKLFGLINLNSGGLLDFYKPNYGCFTSMDQNKRLFSLVRSFFVIHSQQSWLFGNRPNVIPTLEVQTMLPPGTGIMVGANVLRFNFIKLDGLSTDIRLRITINDGGSSAYDIFFPDANSIAPFSIYLGTTRQRIISFKIEALPSSANNVYAIGLDGIELHEVRQHIPPAL
jgi:hypothetical protein